MSMRPEWVGALLCEASFRREPLAQAVERLAELYSGSAHVASFELLAKPDSEIWSFAQREGFIIVTTDADFYELATTLGPPPKVVWLRRWTHPTRDAELVLRRDAIRMTASPSTLRRQSSYLTASNC